MDDANPLPVAWLVPIPRDAFWAVDHQGRHVSSWSVPGTTMTLGRAVDADVRIRDPEISRLHLKLSWEGNRLMLTHLSGTNPTLLNGEVVDSNRPTELHTLDSLRLGAVELQILIWPAEGDTETKPHSVSPTALAMAARPGLSKRDLMRGFRIGDFHIDPLSGLLTGAGGSRHVQPKVIEVLLCLALKGGELAERETILDEVWGRYASEEVLTRCISELRSLLADDRKSPAYIQTVPKRGYRLLAAVMPDADTDATVRSTLRNPRQPGD